MKKNILQGAQTQWGSEITFSYEQIKEDYQKILDLYDHALDCWEIALECWDVDDNRNNKLFHKVENCFKLKIKPDFNMVTTIFNNLSTNNPQYKYLEYRNVSKKFHDLMKEFDAAYDRFYKYEMHSNPKMALHFKWGIVIALEIWFLFVWVPKQAQKNKQPQSQIESVKANTIVNSPSTIAFENIARQR